MKIYRIIHYIGTALIILLLSSCDNEHKSPGYSYFPDMEESQAYETYSENPYMPGNKTMAGPVEGTVHTKEYAYNFVKTPEDELKAASLVNPLADSLNLKKATILYNRFCIVCHGENGDGQGILYTSKKYPIQPSSYHAERAIDKTDGQLFHNIRAGFGVMGPHGAMMSIDDSWQLVNYIRHLQAIKKPEDGNPATEDGGSDADSSENAAAEN
ncbi:MAG: c-type cytochrome [Prolixibacteraceae bacterium]